MSALYQARRTTIRLAAGIGAKTQAAESALDGSARGKAVDAKSNADFGFQAGVHEVAAGNEAVGAALDAVLSAVSDAAGWLFPDGRLLPLNQAWHDLHGSDPERAQPLDLAQYERQFFPSGGDRTSPNPLRRALAGERLWRTRFPTASGELLWSSVAVPGVDGQVLLVHAAPNAPSQRTGNALLEGRLQHGTTRALADSHNLEDAATSILHRVIQELRLPFASLWLADKDHGDLRCVQALSLDRSECMDEFRSVTLATRYQRGHGVPGRTFESKRPLWVSDLTEDHPIAAGADAGDCGVRSAAGFPVLDGDDVLGVIELYSRRREPRDPFVEELLHVIGSQIGQYLKRSEAESALIRSEQRLLFALEAASLGTWEWDRSSGEVRWSDNMEHVHGMEPGTFQHTFESFLANVHPADRDRVCDTIERSLRDMGDYQVEYRVNDPQRELWVECKGRVFRDSEGQALGLTGICANISERKQSEQRFRLAVEASPNAVVMLDHEGRVTFANQQVTRLFGHQRETLVGEPIQRLLPHDGPGQHPVLRRLREGDADHGPGEITEATGVDAGGRVLPVSVAVNPITVGAQRYVLCALTDISERKRAEENIRRVNEQLWRKNQEMEQFVYSVSHDLKSPLVTVTGFVGMLKEDLAAGNSEGATDSVERIERATRRMSALINDLLQLSRIGRVEIDRQTVSLQEVIGDLQQDMKDRFEARGARLVVEEPLPNVSADRARVVEVLDNLLSNALKYGCTSPGAVVTVGAVRHPSETCIFVRDQGPGIPKAYHGKIFQAFQRLSNSADGTGIGLAIVEKIMRTHGGRVWVDSDEGKGSEFWLAFPERPM